MDHTTFAKSYKTNFGDIRSLSESIIQTVEKKNREYGESFRLRGGQGAYFAYVRKPDRLESQLSRRGYDIFDVSIENGVTEEIDETIKDEIGYLLLILETRNAIRAWQDSQPKSFPDSSQQTSFTVASAVASGLIQTASPLSLSRNDLSEATNRYVNQDPD